MRSPGHNSVVDRQKNALMSKETEQRRWNGSMDELPVASHAQPR